MKWILSRKVRWILIAVMLLVFMFSSRMNAQTAVPSDFGAKGALQDQDISIEEALTYALQDEYLALARYEAVTKKYGNILPFSQIVQAEQQHIEAIKRLMEQYEIEIPVYNAKQYITTPVTLKEAFQTGVKGEIDNIAMYETFLKIEELPNDIAKVFSNLRDASKKHLIAFNFGLAQSS
ncbi:ferritin-like domain-containing protein [Pontibacillus yanchengensis]|uniref:DUF2202 domain-containing protein n=1 Tax=Pontibacillus yanchengensis Y32 TaxID=1385514 RepID=A0A0A2TE57_9BACI|nr:DUF2202 domain-containing protein [Pontibacillus yanchengensis]KGP72713.1 hypothetical protein N782_10700 [Pontibacillus yanchengensis Y32]